MCPRTKITRAFDYLRVLVRSPSMEVLAMNEQPPPRDLSKWLTRIQAMDLMAVSIQTLMKWETEGRLHPEKRPRAGSGRLTELVYDPQELAALPRGRSRKRPPDEGELEARAFEMFEAGATIKQIVLALRVTVERAKALREEWIDASEG